MGGGALCRRAAALRLGQRLAAPAGGEMRTGARDTIAPYRDLSYDALVNDFIAALPSPNLADQIMRDNPARLYGF